MMFSRLLPDAARFAGAFLLATVTGTTLLLLPVSASARPTLPLDTVFRGQAKFDSLVERATKEDWRALPIGERTARVGLALQGTPYRGYTLEIDDHVEAPSVNLLGLDCWTFYEVSLGFARMLKAKSAPYTPEDLLQMIELDRYRHGQCTGEYLSRIHFLEELFYDNQKRDLMVNITPQLPGAERMGHRDIREMTVMWRHYRYLRNNPSLRPEMARIEARVSDLTVYHVPKSRVPSVEKDLQTGDIIAITSRDTGGYTSHVGLAFRDSRGTLRFLHASSKQHEVVLDTRLSSYLNDKHDDIGIVVARPLEVPTGMVAAR